jgi:hypothetical protein
MLLALILCTLSLSKGIFVLISAIQTLKRSCSLGLSSLGFIEMKVFMFGLFVFAFVLVSSGNLYAYNFQTVNVDCGSSLLSKPVCAKLNLTNTGGINVFYISTNTSEAVYHLYDDVTLKPIVVTGDTNSSGVLRLDVSANYGGSYTLTPVSCESLPDVSSKFFPVLMGFMAIVLIGTLLYGLYAAVT